MVKPEATVAGRDGPVLTAAAEPASPILTALKSPVIDRDYLFPFFAASRISFSLV